MVLSTTSRHLWRTLDSGRIAGIAAAVLVNLALVAALTTPPAPVAQPWVHGSETDDYLHWIVVPTYDRMLRLACGHCEQRHFPHLLFATLKPIDAPTPIYPIDALRDGVSGTVMLALLVDVDGRVSDVNIESSSGDHRLDSAARDQVLRNWRFKPETRNGVPVQVYGRLPVEFKLYGR